jgi:hypothetical protein
MTSELESDALADLASDAPVVRLERAMDAR